MRWETGGNRRRRGRRPPEDGTPWIIIGLFSSPTGVGQGARLMYADCRARGRTVVAIDVTEALRLPSGRRPEGVSGPEALDDAAPGLVVAHLNPPLYGHFYGRIPKALRKKSFMVGYWAWELPRVPETWAIDAALVDEIWTPSAFVANAVRATFGEGECPPVRVVPHAVRACPLGPPIVPERRRCVRRHHGLPEDAFVVGYSFAMASNFARKNPLATIAAFRAAFPDEEAALLLLRCNDLADWPPGREALLAAARADPRIRLIGGTCPTMPIEAFYAAIDVLLSLHRSEGYGLTIAEAASLGVPVIATGWGLAEELCAEPLVRTVSYRLVAVEDPQGAYDSTQVWAEPDVAEAASALRQLWAERCRPGGGAGLGGRSVSCDGEAPPA